MTALELLTLIGLSDRHFHRLRRDDWNDVLPRLRMIPGKEGLESVPFPLFKVELTCGNPVIKAPGGSIHDLTDAFPAMVMVPATTIPLPTRATWLAATPADPDWVLLRQAMETNVNLDKSQLVNKGYHHAHKDKVRP